MLSVTRSQNAFAERMSCFSANEASSIATLSPQPQEAFHLASVSRADGCTSLFRKSRSSLPANAVTDATMSTPTSTRFITDSFLRFVGLHDVIELDLLGGRLRVDDREVDLEVFRVEEVPRAVASIEEHGAIRLAALLPGDVDGLALVAPVLELVEQGLSL